MKPEEVFRFVNVRPAKRISRGRTSKWFATYGENMKAPLHSEIEKYTGPDARDRAIELAQQRLLVDDGYEKELELLLEAMQKAAATNTVLIAREEAEKVLGQTLVAYLQSATAHALRDSLWDRLYAHTLVPEERPEDRELVYEGIRAFHFLEWLVLQKDDEKPLTMAELAKVTPTIPVGVIPGLPEGRDTGEGNAAETLMALEAVYNGVVSINAAIRDLYNNDRVYRAQELRTVVNVGAEPCVQPMQSIPLTGPVTESSHRPTGKCRSSCGCNCDCESGADRTPPMVYKVIMVPKKALWIFAEFGQKNLLPATQALLAVRKPNLNEMEFAEVISALEQEKYELVSGFLKQIPAEALQYVRSSNQFGYILKEVPVASYPVSAAAPASPAAPAAAFGKPGSALARGIQPLGIGDLLVVKQELLRYTAGEVAHIENVMKSESKNRMHSRLREVEEIVITETEQIEESEKDLQTTERFELQKEAQKAIENQMSLDAGVVVTATYGPVTVTAHADFALSQSSSESNRIASTFAKQITDHSVSRIRRRSREERTRRTLERFEEKNEHGFDNKDGSGHVIGIYRWVDKYYKARLINYGRRLMIEFIVPEPATFFLHLQSGQSLEGVTMKKPKEPMASGHRLKPTDLTKWNYADFVAQYNVQDVEAYPAEVTRVSAAFAETTGAPGNASYANTSEKLNVPAGYMCVDLFGKSGSHGVDDGENPPDFDCLIAGQRWGSVTAYGIEGTIPISVKGWLEAFHLNVVAVCELKPETREAWQIKTYAAIMSAYENALADYNNQVVTAQLQAGVAIEGRNPGFNRKIEREELQKGALRLLTNNFAKTRVSGKWRYNEKFNAAFSNGPYGYPDFNVEEALVEGKIIQFFEQAFEWHNMTYRFYPYSWGRKDKWKDIFPLTDTDPQFIDFLRAGAARVIVPVHPSYNETMLHYMATNEIWNGGDPPTLYDPLYISIVDELKADADGDLDGDLPACDVDSPYPCLADEWEVKLPTTLVYLQEDAQLPDFTV